MNTRDSAANIRKSGEQGPAAIGSEKRSGWPWFVGGAVRFFLLICCVCAISFIGGFLWFVEVLQPAVQTVVPKHADGIVVLTGGRDRISQSLDLLETGSAKRLLISGVHPSTSAKQIARMNSKRMWLFDCCVDLDRKAQNTIGNAEETASWVRENQFNSLLVVTSAYHMPRALAELQVRLPNASLYPSPVYHRELDLERWYESSSITKLLLREYVKYILVRLRVELDVVFPVNRLS
ncbi:hypothetical protein PsAD2_01626 [Pseudovibrio axinellae]|uniref:DUF218 domain-containing protein n=1 Tax=Pseudovibrio axinellae TaxID=989403 RepID=A0A161V5M6_9HYPH|nr:YdcF family protein [Pseudovibrio axinellae]KZL20139.1 hypothetical protein PsAD2_01626 [Pseudovibrio axinellae]SEQ23670.1 DUF218 domain-containing protein [Pseudovibrio axinellae]